MNITIKTIRILTEHVSYICSELINDEIKFILILTLTLTLTLILTLTLTLTFK